MRHDILLHPLCDGIKQSGFHYCRTLMGYPTEEGNKAKGADRVLYIMAKKYIVVRIEREGNALVANAAGATKGFSKAEAQRMVSKDCIMLSYENGNEYKALAASVLDGTHAECNSKRVELYGEGDGVGEEVPVDEYVLDVPVECDTVESDAFEVSPLADTADEEEKEEDDNMDAIMAHVYSELNDDDRNVLLHIGNGMLTGTLGYVHVSALFFSLFPEVSDNVLQPMWDKLIEENNRIKLEREVRIANEKRRAKRNEQIAKEAVVTLWKELEAKGIQRFLLVPEAIETVEKKAVADAIRAADEAEMWANNEKKANTVVKHEQKKDAPVRESKEKEVVYEKEMRLPKKQQRTPRVEESRTNQLQYLTPEYTRTEEESMEMIRDVVGAYDGNGLDAVTVMLALGKMLDTSKEYMFLLFNGTKVTALDRRQVLHIVSESIAWLDSDDVDGGRECFGCTDNDSLWFVAKEARDIVGHGSQWAREMMNNDAKVISLWNKLVVERGFCIGELIAKAHGEESLSAKQVRNIVMLYSSVYATLFRALTKGKKVNKTKA